jgi:hypothetical protein
MGFDGEQSVPRQKDIMSMMAGFYLECWSVDITLETLNK